MMNNNIEALTQYINELEAAGVSSDLVSKGRRLQEDLYSYNQQRDGELDRLLTVMDHVPCTISHISSDLKYLGVNKFLADACQMSATDFIGRDVGFKSLHNYFNNFTKEFFVSADPHAAREIETTVEGEIKHFLVQGIKIKEGKEAVIIGIDITELTALKDTIVFLDRLSSVGEMMAGILHEISNPLTLIKSYGQKLHKMIDNQTLDEEKVKKSADIITGTSDKIEKIVAGIKAFVRMSEDKEPEPTPFTRILDDSILICESTLQTANVSLIKEKDEWPMVSVNETQIFQVFVNLITNAIHAVEELPERWIKLDWTEDEQAYIFTLTDSGSGIPKEVQERMFTSFYTTKGVGKGTGLGLSLCCKILEGHEGSISVDNQCANTRFVIKLPKKN